MIICLVRHGESEANKTNVLSGLNYDCELTEKGIKQSKLVGDFFKESNVKFNIVYTSNLKRAKNTARLIESRMGQKFKEFIIDKRLNERNYGKVEGYDLKYLEIKYGKNKLIDWFFSLDEKPPYGESNRELYERVKNFYNELLLLSNKNINVLIVSHMVVTLALISLIRNVDFEKILANLTIKNAVPLFFEI